MRSLSVWKRNIQYQHWLMCCWWRHFRRWNRHRERDRSINNNVCKDSPGRLAGSFTMRDTVHYRTKTMCTAERKTHLLRAQVEGVQVFQGYRHQSFWDLPVDEGEALPGLQVTVGLGLVVVVIVTVTAVLPGRLLVLLLLEAQLEGRQRLRVELLEAVRAWGCEKGRGHVFIL